jgi:glycine dehydrogenase subunit 2
MSTDKKTKVRNFHQAKWDEPVIFELSTEGERGIAIPEVEKEIEDTVGDGVSKLPENMARKEAPALPEISQMRVLKHFIRLSQHCLGADLNVDIGQGTCTMKYSPKINEIFARSTKVAELHPEQDENTAQGALEIMYKLDTFLQEISGMKKFTMQPGGGGSAILAMASIIHAYHHSRGETDKRDEIITTIFSHPSDAAAAAVKGYKVITLYQNEDGLPDVGYDQANANGILGITRANEAGFDLCFFNLHKTFSSPHGCGGPGAGALGVTEELISYLPVPIVEFDGDRYFLNYDLPNTIGKVRAFYGVFPAVLRAYSWVMSLGAEGLKEAANVAVLNNNYILEKIKKIKGASAPYARGRHRIEQVRYSWETLTKETGVTTEDVAYRMADFGFHLWSSHHPFIVPEPFTIEPTESYSKDEIDEYIAGLEKIAAEAYEDPDKVKNAPYNSVVHKIDHSTLDDPEKWAITWRAYLKKHKKK